MDENVLMGFEKLKISAFSKFIKLTGDIHNITIGPNRTVDSPREKKEKPSLKPTRNEEQKIKSYQDDRTLVIQKVLKDHEAQRREKVEEAVKKHQKKFEEFSRYQRRQQEEQWLKQQQRFMDSMREKEQKVVDAMRECEGNRTNQNEKLMKQYQEILHKKMLDEQILEENREKQRILNENIEKIKKCQADFRSCFQEIINIIKTCTANEELKKMLGENFKLLKTLPESIEEVVTKCRSFNVDSNDVSKAQFIITQIQALKNQIHEAVFHINNKKTEQEDKPPPQLPVEQSKKAVAETSTGQSHSIKTEQNLDVTLKQSVCSLEQYISPSNLRRYTELNQFLMQYSQSFKDLVSDERLKQFRFDCKKAVNIPVNTISAVSREHLRDKFDKLSNLLSGKTIIVSDKQINASKHPQGVSFCMDLLAQSFVLQGDLLISSNPEAAFSYATVIVSLWNAFPEFGKLLLAYFYVKFSYLVPFYIPKTDSQTTEEYYISLGYQYKDGQVEKQDKFLKRMTGIMRLYFAILIAKPKSGQSINPHNIRFAWKYFASILKLEPQLNISATALHIFLETVGFEMEATYGKQFKKLIQVLSEKYMPNLKKIDSGGPVSRLELLLREYKEKGRFEKPNGVLNDNFW